MSTLPKISIAIPTFNEENNIERCLSSIQNQRYAGKLEVFIIDGRSTDDTIKKAKKYNVILLQNTSRQAEYGKKIGLEHATGKYFMILDCDMDIVGSSWFEKMISPLEKDKTIVGSWTKFISDANDASLNKYITLDAIQRDPLFSFLTPSIESCVIEKNNEYWTLKYHKNKILPAGFCIYRREDLVNTQIWQMKKYMELDNLILLLENGKNKYAYIQGIGVHHPFLTTLKNLLRKRIRNIKTMYFNQPDKRYWTWIDWNNPIEKLKIVIWVVYTFTIIPSCIVGIWKCIQYKTWVGLYEMPFNLLSTIVVMKEFLSHKEGRKMIINNNQR